MFPNLSRAKDEALLRGFGGGTLRSLNLDRIRSVIDNGGAEEDRTKDQERILSLEQVVEYDPELLALEDVGCHFVDYCVMQKTCPPVIRKIVELWPTSISDDETLFKLLGYCEENEDQPEFLALTQFLETQFDGGEASDDDDDCSEDDATPQQENVPVLCSIPESTCAFPSCHQPGVNTCSQCKRIQYCSREHQKADWKLHKPMCTNAPRHIVSGHYICDIQKAIDQANPGDVIELVAGIYSAGVNGAGVLSIAKPLRLVGAGMDDTRLHVDLKIFMPPSHQSNQMLVVSSVGIDGIVSITETNYNEIIFLSTEVKCPPGRNGEVALDIQCHGKVTLNACEIVGGMDGLRLGENTRAIVKDTDISDCKSRGIFANGHLTIGPDTRIYNCGGYGIKGQRGWNEVGKNQIQLGPWNSFGGPSGY